MDHDIALHIFKRWEQGLPVQEMNFYKAAAELGVNPRAALLEARYYTELDAFCKTASETGDWRLTPFQARFFAAAAGLSVDSIEKVASRFWNNGEGDPLASLVTLRDRNWVPNLLKLAEAMQTVQQSPQSASMAPGQGASDPMQGGGQDPAQADLEQQQAMAAQGGGDPMAPQQGQEVQQQPMFRPSPTAPSQMAPSEEGNLQAILEASQQAAQQPGQGGQPGQEDPVGGGQDVPPPPTPEQKLQQSVPGIDEKTLGRWAPQLAQLEQQTGITVTDPKQLMKFVQQMQKADGKVIDEAIKQIADQQVQQQQMNGIMGGQQQMQQKQQQLAAGAAGQVPQQPLESGQQAQQGAMQKLAEAMGLAAHGRLFG